MSARPPILGRLWHLALQVRNLEACEHFYTELLGMKVEWRPDDNNVYLTSGHDNLALHQVQADFAPNTLQHLDHLGFVVPSMEMVDAWYEFLKINSVPILKELKTHRDGARSFYCRDPDGNVLQIIFHPPLSRTML